jgi:hypothetical protein
MCWVWSIYEKVALTSLLPRPKPLTTSPFNLSGNGGAGPLSGPTIGSRGPSGRMLFDLWCFDVLLYG